MFVERKIASCERGGNMITVARESNLKFESICDRYES